MSGTLLSQTSEVKSHQKTSIEAFKGRPTLILRSPSYIYEATLINLRVKTSRLGRSTERRRKTLGLREIIDISSSRRIPKVARCVMREESSSSSKFCPLIVSDVRVDLYWPI